MSLILDTVHQKTVFQKPNTSDNVQNNSHVHYTNNKASRLPYLIPPVVIYLTPTFLHSERNPISSIYTTISFIAAFLIVLPLSYAVYCPGFEFSSFLPISLIFTKPAFLRLNLLHRSRITNHVHVPCVRTYKYSPVSILQVPIVQGSVLSKPEGRFWCLYSIM
jgi:hypothetical protein